MSRVLYYECFSGISGDMNLGSLIDLGVDKDYLIKELVKLNVSDEYEIKVNTDNRKGIYGTKVDVLLKYSENCKHTHDHHCQEHHNESVHNHIHEHICDHEHIDEHDNCNNHSHKHNHVHRNLQNINKIIDNSDLNDNIKEISKNIFLKVAEAEGRVHNKPLEEVHFHEVGATDSIVDIVGAAICLDYLKVDRILSSTVELGSGFVKCAHGMLPVPAPATIEILNNIPIVSGTVPFEATTPTGAAILATMVDEFTDTKRFNILKTGYGIGGKDIGDIPNVLRVFLAEDKKKLVN